MIASPNTGPLTADSIARLSRQLLVKGVRSDRVSELATTTLFIDELLAPAALYLAGAGVGAVVPVTGSPLPEATDRAAPDSIEQVCDLARKLDHTVVLHPRIERSHLRTALDAHLSGADATAEGRKALVYLFERGPDRRYSERICSNGESQSRVLEAALIMEGTELTLRVGARSFPLALPFAPPSGAEDPGLSALLRFAAALAGAAALLDTVLMPPS